MSQHLQLRRILLALTVLLPLVSASSANAQNSKALTLKKQGDAQVASGDQAAAEESYKKAVAADPSYQEGYTALSTHYLRQRKYDEAISLLERAVKRDRSYGEGWYNLAYALRKRGKMSAAVKAYRTFSRMEPASADPYFGLGLAYKAQGKFAEAADAFRRYTELEKRSDRASWSAKAGALADEMLKKAAAGAPAAKADPAPAPAAVPAPAARESARQEGDRLYREGKVAEAAEKYLAAIKANSGDTASLDALATCLFRLRRYSKAVKVFQASVKANPDYNQAWYNLAYALRKLGRHAKAVRAYQRYIEKDPDNADPYFGLALAYKGMGKKSDAATSFERYIEKERRPGQEKWIHQARVEIARMRGKGKPASIHSEPVTASASAAPPALPGLPPVDNADKQPVAAREAEAAEEAKPAAATSDAGDEEARRQRERDMAMMDATAAYADKSKGRKRKGARELLPLVTPAEDRPMAPPAPEEPDGKADSASDKLRQQGDTLARMGKCQQAQPLFVRATRKDPFNTAAYSGLAYCAYQLGQYQQGTTALRVGMRDNIGYHVGWLHKARLERAARENISAAGSYSRYISKSKGKPIPDAYFELARTLRDLKMKDKAVISYGKYLRAENRAFAASQVLAAHQEMIALGGTPPATKITMPGDGGRTVTVEEYLKGRKSQAEAQNKEARAEAGKAARLARLQARKEAKERKIAEAKAAREAKIQARKDARERKIAEANAAREAKIRAHEEANTRKDVEGEAARQGTSTGAPETGAGSDSVEVARAVSGGLSAGGTLPFPGAQTPTSMYKSAIEAARGLVRMADREFSRRHLVVAMGLYEQAAKLDPSSVEALYKGGATAMALGQMDLASSFYRKVLRLNSDDEAARFNLELCRRSAREQASEAQLVKSRTRRVESLLAARQYAAAAKAATVLLTMSPAAEVYMLRGQARLGQGNSSGAMNDGGRALSLNPDLSGAIRLLGDANRKAGKNKKAAFFYRLFLARTPITSSTEAERAQVQKILKGL